MKYKTTTAPTDTPVPLDVLRSYLGIFGNEHDTHLQTIRAAAVDKVEGDCKIAIIDQTITLYLDDWPNSDTIEFRLGPVTAVDSVKYQDASDVQQTFAASNYSTDIINTPTRIKLAQGATWPILYGYGMNEVEVACSVGYATPGAVPLEIVAAVKEAAKILWCEEQNCECGRSAYDRLIDHIQWTGYHKVLC